MRGGCLTALLSFPVLFSFSDVGHENKKRSVIFTGRIVREDITQKSWCSLKRKMILRD